MSDVERPSRSGPNGGGDGGVPPKGNSAGPARNMADIARLFLDGARPVAGSSAHGAGAGKRTPPGVAGGREAAAPVTNRAVEAGRSVVMLGLARAGHDPANWRLLSCAAAGMAEEQSTTVALVGVVNGEFVVDVFGAEAEELPGVRAAGGNVEMQIARALYTLRASVGMWLVGAPAPETAAFAMIGGKVGEWVLACPTDNRGLLEAYQQLKRASVFARSGVRAEGATHSVFLVDDDFAHAGQVHRRLRTAAQEFLKTDLTLAGVGPLQGAAGQRVFAMAVPGAVDGVWAGVLDELCPAAGDVEAMEEDVNEMAGEVEEMPVVAPVKATSRVVAPPKDIETALENLASSADEISRNSAATTHAVLDHLAQVLDPEERAALSAGFDDDVEEEVPVARPALPRAVRGAPAGRVAARGREEGVYDIRSQVVPPVVVNVSAEKGRAAVEPVKAAELPRAMPAALVGKPVGVTLRAFDVLEKPEQDRVAQWEAVERSIRDLVPHSVLLDARPPMSWATESCIAIDAEGGLHVWTLYKDGASWFALREWASEHRNLLALTRRDLVLSKDADVVVHIVLPLEEKERGGEKGEEKVPSIVNTIMRTPAKNIHLYRLRVVQWNARRGMVVVPIA